MNQDPAFLFYSKDFYEGTRLMLPEERACYIDLMIYQHQKGAIPNNSTRLQMYCSGCSKDTIERVLNEHFKLTANGWLNLRLDHEVKLRSLGRPKKIASAVFAGLISGSKLTKNQKEKLKAAFDINNFILENSTPITNETDIKQRVRNWFNQMVNQLQNKRSTIYEDVNEIENGTKVEIKKETANEKIMVSPFESNQFRTQWEQWKAYKAEQFNFRYRSAQSEQAALVELANKALQNEQTAIAILHQSMANGWKGFFKLKQQAKNNEQVFTEALGSTVGKNFRFK
ncbi:hypothetical protein NBRC110019_20350 [Neptunitalea chrysea]|uniref:DUF1376 domain-containing protein n=1 Tax=Neptunitalea chrysea TaxID=1647581 RepID=A0A9W6B7H2_9FLAO|nr:DUF1376 domain-containing protein [Neptunitalea chrysea]GLB52995.1 hypothetical protein NBRC110019_20350 [Neptunitalea chrysea]